jgi:hypothetical protein
MVNISPSHYKPLSAKIPLGDLSFNLDGEKSFDKVPSLKDILLSQEVFLDFEIKIKDCKYQINTSKGKMQKAKVVSFDGKYFSFVSFNYTCFIITKAVKASDYCLLGNILYKVRK